jgi:hypothetical protein
VNAKVRLENENIAEKLEITTASSIFSGTQFIKIIYYIHNE